MNNYIEAVCEGKPMGLPEYDMDAEQWAVYFEESSTPWHPNQERDVLPADGVNAEEAADIYTHDNQSPAIHQKEDEQATS